LQCKIQAYVIGRKLNLAQERSWGAGAQNAWQQSQAKSSFILPPLPRVAVVCRSATKGVCQAGA